MTEPMGKRGRIMTALCARCGQVVGGKSYSIPVTKNRDALLVMPPDVTKKDINRIRAWLSLYEASLEDDEAAAPVVKP